MNPSRARTRSRRPSPTSTSLTSEIDANREQSDLLLVAYRLGMPMFVGPVTRSTTHSGYTRAINRMQLSLRVGAVLSEATLRLPRADEGLYETEGSRESSRYNHPRCGGSNAGHAGLLPRGCRASAPADQRLAQVAGDHPPQICPRRPAPRRILSPTVKEITSQKPALCDPSPYALHRRGPDRS
jgi:hypothetical protein